jgi:hypothetical protein
MIRRALNDSLTSLSVADKGETVKFKLETTVISGHRSNGDCDGDCKYYPFLVIPNSTGDRGVRPSTLTPVLGPDSPSIWFEEYNPDGTEGTRVARPIIGGNYQIVVHIENLGSAPSFALCVDFLVWTSTSQEDGNEIHHYSMVSAVRSAVVMDSAFTEIRSDRWSPGPDRGLFPGDTIIRIYDPLADHYSETGVWLYVTNDRHLGHKSFS